MSKKEESLKNELKGEIAKKEYIGTMFLQMDNENEKLLYAISGLANELKIANARIKELEDKIGVHYSIYPGLKYL